MNFIKLEGRKEDLNKKSEVIININRINIINKFEKVNDYNEVGYVQVGDFNYSWYLDKENYNKLLNNI